MTILRVPSCVKNLSKLIFWVCFVVAYPSLDSDFPVTGHQKLSDNGNFLGCALCEPLESTLRTKWVGGTLPHSANCCGDVGFAPWPTLLISHAPHPGAQLWPLCVPCTPELPASPQEPSGPSPELKVAVRPDWAQQAHQQWQGSATDPNCPQGGGGMAGACPSCVGATGAQHGLPTGGGARVGQPSCWGATNYQIRVSCGGGVHEGQRQQGKVTQDDDCCLAVGSPQTWLPSHDNTTSSAQ